MLWSPIIYFLNAYIDTLNSIFDTKRTAELHTRFNWCCVSGSELNGFSAMLSNSCSEKCCTMLWLHFGIAWCFLLLLHVVEVTQWNNAGRNLMAWWWRFNKLHVAERITLALFPSGTCSMLKTSWQNVQHILKSRHSIFWSAIFEPCYTHWLDTDLTWWTERL